MIHLLKNQKLVGNMLKNIINDMLAEGKVSVSIDATGEMDKREISIEEICKALKQNIITSSNEMENNKWVYSTNIFKPPKSTRVLFTFEERERKHNNVDAELVIINLEDV